MLNSLKDFKLLREIDYNIAKKIWTKYNINQIYFSKNKKNNLFIIHSGPTYANNKIHVGNLYNLLLKDFLNKHAKLTGKTVNFIHGMDMHGLPVLNAVLKEKFNNVYTNDYEIYHACNNFAQQSLQNIKNSMKQFGILCNDNFLYNTTQKSFRNLQIDIFYTLYQKKFISTQNRPIDFCISCNSLLAFSELKEQKQLSDSLYFLMPTDKYNTYFLIWTTIPFSLLFNQALGIDNNGKYVIFEYQNKNIICSENFFLKQKTTLHNIKKIKDISIHELQNMKILSSFSSDRPTYKKPVFAFDYIDCLKGTGVVHLSSDCSKTDYIFLKQRNIFPMLDFINFWTQTLQQNKIKTKLFFTQARTYILDLITKKQLLYSLESQHKDILLCQRCNNSVVTMSSNQWFVDLETQNIKTKIFENLPNIFPEQNTLKNIIEQRNNWCISRNRVWGTFIPSFYCFNCKTNLVNEESVSFLKQLISNNQHIAWINNKFKPTCQFCKQNNTILKHETFDVWFDAGCTSIFLKKQLSIDTIDFLIEGHDQFKGWFQCLILLEQMFNNTCSIQNIMAHSFVTNKEGDKISKSKNNFNDINMLLENLEIDVIRLFFADKQLGSEVKVNTQNIVQATKCFKTIKTHLRFLLWIFKNNVSYLKKHLDIEHIYQNKNFTSFLEEQEKQLCKKYFSMFRNIHMTQIQKRLKLLENVIGMINTEYIEKLRDYFFTDLYINHSNKQKTSIFLMLFIWLIVVSQISSPYTSFLSENVWQILKNDINTLENTIFNSQYLYLFF